MKSFASTPWTKRSQIIIALDIGTTHSAVSFAFLNRGGPQSVHRVVEWPGQEAQRSESKIPSILWYDSDKKAVSFGAEALTPQAEEDAEDQHWTLARHFKLHLHPSTMSSHVKKEPLPTGIPLTKIYTDFIRYLLTHTEKFFTSHILDGASVWKKYSPTMEIVIAHPNGWGFKEQSFLREATIAAYTTSAVDLKSTRSTGGRRHGLAQDDLATRIRFISEAEASVHFCIFHTNIESRMQIGVNFVVCDAGGSTVDTTAYKVSATSPLLQLEEKKVPACIQAGGIFVNITAEQYLRRTLSSAGVPQDDIDEYVKKGMKDFEVGAKKAFQGDGGSGGGDQTIDLAGARFNNAELRVRRGRMTLPGSVVKSFFQKWIDEIVKSVSSQISGLSVKHILLVGGFGDSLFLRHVLSEHFNPLGCHVTISNDATGKAVADGAIIYAAKSSVISRVARYTYGTWVRSPYDPINFPEHRGRTVCRNAGGQMRIEGKWKPLIKKGTSAKADEAFLEPVRKTYTESKPVLSEIRKSIFAYTGEGEAPYWLFDNHNRLAKDFEKVCVVSADLTGLEHALEKRQGTNGTISILHFEIGVRFGGTQLEAFLQWDENGEKRTGPAAILPQSLVEE